MGTAVGAAVGTAVGTAVGMLLRGAPLASDEEVAVEVAKVVVEACT